MIKLIAETAWHHDGDYEFMCDLIEKSIQEAKADIIKLHITLDFEEYITSDHLGYDFLKERLLTEQQWEHIISKILNSEKELMLLFNDRKAIEFGMQFNPSLVEIHSVCLNDIHLLNALNTHNPNNIPVVLGVGGSTVYEIENAIRVLNTNDIVLMHGFQNYPTKYEDINFKRIRKIMNLYPGLKHGYADHTAWDEPNNILISTMGAALGMNYIEKHVTTHPGKERTDWQAAIGFMEFNQLAANIALLNKCNGNGNLALNKGEKAYSVFGPMKKAAILRRDVKKGEVLSENCIDMKRTKNISNLSQLDVIESFGKVFSADLPEGHCLMDTDLS